jgi:hypothetical protein
LADQFLQWFIWASVAPRGFVYSYELGWNVDDLPGRSRYRKVWGLYGAMDHLAEAQGLGPFPGPGEAWNIGPAQRRSLYPTPVRLVGMFASGHRNRPPALQMRRIVMTEVLKLVHVFQIKINRALFAVHFKAVFVLAAAGVA